MSVPRDPRPVKLFFAILFRPGSAIEEVERRIGLEFSPIDLRTEDFAFTHTDYYQAEMGAGLCKRFISCERPIDPGELASIKLHTNRVERFHARPGAGGGEADRGGRTINIDPGWLDPSRVVLATGKDYSHRIYVGQRVYEEVTLMYRRRPPGYEPLPWTYPDYRRAEVLRFFNTAREICRAQGKGRPKP